MRLKRFAVAILLFFVAVGVLSACQNGNEPTNPNTDLTPDPIPNPSLDLDISFYVYTTTSPLGSPPLNYSKTEAGKESLFSWHFLYPEEKVFKCSLDVQGDGIFEFELEDCRSSIEGRPSIVYEFRYTYPESDKGNFYQPKIVIKDEQSNSFEKTFRLKILDTPLDIDFVQGFLLNDNRYFVWINTYSEFDLDSVKAELEGQSKDMQFEEKVYCQQFRGGVCYLGFVAVFDINDKTPGEKIIKVIIGDVEGNQKTREFNIDYDPAPTFSIDDSLFANPTLPLSIPCVDNNPDECTITVGLFEDIGDVYGYPVQEFTQKGRFQLDLDLSSRLWNSDNPNADRNQDGVVALTITVTDSSQQSVRLERQVYILPNDLNITTVLQVPGTIEALSSKAVVYSSSVSRPSLILLPGYTIPDYTYVPTSATLFYQDLNTKEVSKNLLPKDILASCCIHLFDGRVIFGAAIRDPDSSSFVSEGIYEWRAGQSESIKITEPSVSINGVLDVNDTHILFSENSSTFVLHNLQTQTNQLIPLPFSYETFSGPRLTKDGAIILINTVDHILYLWRNGTLAQITDSLAWPLYETPNIFVYDNDVIYAKTNSSGDVAIARYSSGVETLLTPYHPEARLVDYKNGWLMYTRKSGLMGTKLWFRNLQGEEKEIKENVVALAPTGEYITVDSRVKPDGSRQPFNLVPDLGSNLKLMWIDGDWKRVLGSRVFQSK